MPIEQTPPRSKVHGLIITLLFALLLLSLAAVALLVATQKTAPGKNDLSLACKTEVQSAVLDATREITRACKPDTTPSVPTTGTVPARTGTVGFIYPLGWSVKTESRATGNTNWIAQLVPGYFSMCVDCDGPFIDINLAVSNKNDPAVTKFQDFNAYLQAYYSSAEIYTNIIITPTTEVTGTRYTVTGAMNGMYTGSFETVYFETATKYAQATFVDTDSASQTTNAAWKIVKDSLDFSRIEE